MSQITPNSLAFDRGIDSITYARNDVAWAMPERGDAPPADVGARAQVEALLQKPNIDTRLDVALRPKIENRGLLSPGRFAAALDGSFAYLNQAAQASSESPEQARVLNRAGRLLGEESSLRDLLQMYRNALFQG